LPVVAGGNETWEYHKFNRTSAHLGGLNDVHGSGGDDRDSVGTIIGDEERVACWIEGQADRSQPDRYRLLTRSEATSITVKVLEKKFDTNAECPSRLKMMRTGPEPVGMRCTTCC